MDAVGKRKTFAGFFLGFVNEFRYLFVGEKHVLLDELVRIEMLFFVDTDRLAGCIELKSNFFLFEINRAFLPFFFLQKFCKSIELTKLGVILKRRVVDCILGSFIGEAFGGFDDRASKPFRVDMRFCIYFKYCREGELVLVLIERAELIGKFKRKHGDSPVRQVHRASALICFFIKLAFFADIMRDVGNMYADLIIIIGKFLE